MYDLEDTTSEVGMAIGFAPRRRGSSDTKWSNSGSRQNFQVAGRMANLISSAGPKIFRVYWNNFGGFHCRKFWKFWSSWSTFGLLVNNLPSMWAKPSEPSGQLVAARVCLLYHTLKGVRRNCKFSQRGPGFPGGWGDFSLPLHSLTSAGKHKHTEKKLHL